MERARRIRKPDTKANSPNKARVHQQAQPVDTAHDQIMQLQQQYGNQAVMRMLESGMIRVAGNTIQRMPSVMDAQAALPVSKKKTAKTHRQNILQQVQDFHAIIQNYPDNFPDTPERLQAGEAQTYYNNTLLQLNTISAKINTDLATYKNYFTNIPGKLSSKKRKEKYADRAESLGDFGFKIDRSDGEKHLAPLHQRLYMQVMTSDPNLNFMDESMRTAVGNGTASGTVNVVGKATYNMPGKGDVEGFSKTDIAATSDPGYASGIRKETANMGMRSVATFEVSELIGLGIVPLTALTKFNNPDGSVTTGQFMETAKGTSGFKDDLEDLPISPQQQTELDNLYEQYNDPDNSNKQRDVLMDQIRAVSNNTYPVLLKKGPDGHVKKSNNAISNFDYKDPQIQKHLATLQMFDNVVGHGDRHAGNYFLEHARGDKGNVTGLKAIDNDDTFGESFTGNKVGTLGKTKPLPQVLDGDVALKILSTSWDDMKAILEKYRMTQAQIDATESRWRVVVDHVKNLVRTDKLALDNGGEDNFAHVVLYTQLYSAMGEDMPEGKTAKFLTWGDETEDFFDNTNSYAGREQKYLDDANRLGNRAIYEPQ